MDLMVLGLKGIVTLVCLSFLRGSVRLTAPLQMLADSRSLWGFGGGGARGKNRVELMGLGMKANNLPVFLSFFRRLVRLRAPLELLAHSQNMWGFGRGPEVKIGWN